MAARGIELTFGLNPGLQSEDAVAVALGNLTGWQLVGQRKERLEWRILRVQEIPDGHHYVLLLRHPDRLLDFGLKGDLRQVLESLQSGSEQQILDRFGEVCRSGRTPVKLETVREKADYWLDDDWALHWVGDAAGVDR